MNEQEFPQGSVPVAVAARVYGKDASWVRAGIVSGWLPIGKATRSGKLVTTIEEMDSRYSGKPPKPENGTWWIWDAEKGTYVNTNISCELTGPTGNGIQSIQLTQGNHTPGSTDIYTVTMTDGSKYNIAVYNGLNGTGTGDVLGIHFDLVLPASGWSNGSITVAESRLVAAAKYKYLIDAYEASREEYLECNVRPKDISTTGFITFVNDTDPIKDITVNIVRLELSVNAEEGGE